MRARTRLADEGGWAVVTALLLMTIMLGVGLATLASVDTQQQQAGVERVKERAFNLTEAVLDAQAFQLARRWPLPSATGGAPAAPYPASCTGSISNPAPPADVRCPDPTRFASAFAGPDLGAGAAFTTEVRDNGATSVDFYDPAVVPTQPTYDANNDGRMWVKATSAARGRTRSIVALVRADVQVVQFPRKTIIAGKLSTSNNGNKIIVDTDGLLGNVAAEPAGVSLRCAAGTACLDVPNSKEQVSPPVIDYDYPNPQALDDSTLALLREQAASNGTLYPTCPPTLTGAIVYIDSGDCSYGANGVGNPPPGDPGVVIMRSGTLYLGGNYTFNGIVYLLNQQGSDGDCVQVHGTAAVNGAVFVDGSCGVITGSSKENVAYDQRSFGNLRIASDGAIVRNTWRELPST